MIRAVVIDDDSDSREVLLLYLSQYKFIQVLGIADDVNSGIKTIERIKPDLVFLDINMPDGTGFDLIENLNAKDFQVIFITAFDHYAIKAFQFSAIDYLLKPIDPDLLEKAIYKVKQKENVLSVEERLLNLIQNKTTLKKISLPTSHGYTFVDPNTILYCASDAGYTDVFLNDNKKILVSKSIKEFESILTDFGFFRVHQSYLINLKYVKEYKKTDGGIIVLDDLTEIGIARRRKDIFLDALKKFNQ